MFIAMETYALVRIDYKYDKGKREWTCNFGIGYTENKFTSMYFEKKQNLYQLKYCSKIESSIIILIEVLHYKRKENAFFLIKN